MSVEKAAGIALVVLDACAICTRGAGVVLYTAATGIATLLPAELIPDITTGPWPDGIAELEVAFPAIVIVPGIGPRIRGPTAPAELPFPFGMGIALAAEIAEAL